MKIYIPRIGWYLLLAPMVLLALRGAPEFARGALAPAVAMYLPVSFCWLVISFFMYRHSEFRDRHHKEKLKILYGAILLGLSISLSYRFHDSIDLAQCGCILALMGTEGILVLREHTRRRAYS